MTSRMFGEMKWACKVSSTRFVVVEFDRALPIHNRRLLPIHEYEDVAADDVKRRRIARRVRQFVVAIATGQHGQRQNQTFSCVSPGARRVAEKSFTGRKA